MASERRLTFSSTCEEEEADGVRKASDLFLHL